MKYNKGDILVVLSRDVQGQKIHLKTGALVKCIKPIGETRTLVRFMRTVHASHSMGNSRFRKASLEEVKYYNECVDNDSFSKPNINDLGCIALVKTANVKRPNHFAIRITSPEHPNTLKVVEFLKKNYNCRTVQFKWTEGFYYWRDKDEAVITCGLGKLPEDVQFITIKDFYTEYIITKNLKHEEVEEELDFSTVASVKQEVCKQKDKSVSSRGCSEQHYRHNNSFTTKALKVRERAGQPLAERSKSVLRTRRNR